MTSRWLLISTLLLYGQAAQASWLSHAFQACMKLFETNTRTHYLPGDPAAKLLRHFAFVDSSEGVREVYIYAKANEDTVRVFDINDPVWMRELKKEVFLDKSAASKVHNRWIDEDQKSKNVPESFQQYLERLQKNPSLYKDLDPLLITPSSGDQMPQHMVPDRSNKGRMVFMARYQGEPVVVKQVSSNEVLYNEFLKASQLNPHYRGAYKDPRDGSNYTVVAFVRGDLVKPMHTLYNVGIRYFSAAKGQSYLSDNVQISAPASQITAIKERLGDSQLMNGIMAFEREVHRRNLFPGDLQFLIDEKGAAHALDFGAFSVVEGGTSYLKVRSQALLRAAIGRAYEEDSSLSPLDLYSKILSQGQYMAYSLRKAATARWLPYLISE